VSDLWAVLGIVGLAACGPLTATLLIGRTGALPSLRWVGLAVAVWLIAGGIAWASSRERSLRGRLAGLTPLAALAPLLVTAYVSDRDFHLLRLGAGQVVAAQVALLALGVAATGEPVGRWLGRTKETRPAERGSAPSTIAPLAGVALMLFGNDAALEGLGAKLVLSGSAVLPVALICAVALGVAVPSLPAGVGLAAGLTALVGLAAAGAAWLSVGPAGMTEAVGPVMAAIALVLAAQRGFWLPLSRQAVALCATLLALGCAAALTPAPRFGLAAREIVARVPDLPTRLPLVGAIAVAAALALRASVPVYPSRSAAMGGMREA